MNELTTSFKKSADELEGVKKLKELETNSISKISLFYLSHTCTRKILFEKHIGEDNLKRQDAEEFLLNTLNGCKILSSHQFYTDSPNVLFLVKDGKIMFNVDLENKWLSVRYKIWNELGLIYGKGGLYYLGTAGKIKELMETTIEKLFGIAGLVSFPISTVIASKWRNIENDNEELFKNNFVSL